jgi:hypothetical protein
MRPSVSSKASSNAAQDGTIVVDSAVSDAQPIPGGAIPALIFAKANQSAAEFSYVQNSGCLRVRRKFIQSFGTRKNLAKTEKVERDHFREAFVELQRRVYPGQRIPPLPGASPSSGVTYWFKQDEIHQSTHVHAFPPWRGIAFLPWHREIVNRLEDLLREVDPVVSLHYWDFKTDPSDSDGINLMTSAFMGSSNGEVGDPWLSAGFYVRDANPHRDNGSAFDPPLSIRRNKHGGTPQLEANDWDVINTESYSDMRKKLESLHNNAHGYIGGTLGDPHASFKDPFVFLLHSNVDRIWASWQVKPGKQWRLDPELLYGTESNSDVELGAGIYDPGILTPLDPWAGNPNNHPDVQRVRPWTAPENQQVIKNSKHLSVVRPRLYDECVK